MKPFATMFTLRASVAALALAGLASSALADAANPLNGTTAVVKVNGDGSTSVTLQGTWWWPGSRICDTRFGVAWSVDWWGVSSKKTPVPNFTLLNATQLTAHGVTTTGPMAYEGSIAIRGGTYFHVGPYFSGAAAFSKATCSYAFMGGKYGSTGAWSASATYPAGAMIPPQLCVNMYDLLGRPGQSWDTVADLNPLAKKDNSINTNAFLPAGGSCVTVVVSPPPLP